MRFSLEETWPAEVIGHHLCLVLLVQFGMEMGMSRKE